MSTTSMSRKGGSSSARRSHIAKGTRSVNSSHHSTPTMLLLEAQVAKAESDAIQETGRKIDNEKRKLLEQELRLDEANREADAVIAQARLEAITTALDSEQWSIDEDSPRRRTQEYVDNINAMSADAVNPYTSQVMSTD